MEPTPEQVEAVAHVLAERFDGVTLRDPSSPVDVARIHREIAEDVIAAMNAEPLTSTPEPSTTETEREAPISQDPPPGFSWEYRAVVPGCPEGRWSKYDPTHMPVGGWIERRLVGPAERVQD